MMLNTQIYNADYSYNNINNIYQIKNFNNKSKIEIKVNINGYIKFNISEHIINKLLIYNNEKIDILNNITNIFDIKKNDLIYIKTKNDDVNYYDFEINNLNCNYKNNLNVVLITSKIYVSTEIFTYTNTRSIYSKDERFEQTIETIKTIKKNIPNYYIILFDNSKFIENEIIILKKNVNLLINITNNNELNYYTNINKNKGYGELAQTYFALKIINNIPFNNLFKISGRYLINDIFNYNDYDNEYNIFKKDYSVHYDEYYYTCLYKISMKNFNNYLININNLYNEIKNNENIYHNKSYEIFMPKNIIKKEIEYLGITQNIAIIHDNTKI